MILSPYGMPDPASSPCRSVLLNVYCFLNQRRVSDSWSSNLTAAFLRILIPSSLSGRRCVFGAREKPERGPEWVSSENRTPTLTYLPAVGAPLQGNSLRGWLGGGGTKPKVGRGCLWPVSSRARLTHVREQAHRHFHLSSTRLGSGPTATLLSLHERALS